MQKSEDMKTSPIDNHSKCPPIVYKSCLKVHYSENINLKCTCKMARMENGFMVVYTFNEAKMNLPEWIANCDNEAYLKGLWATFESCQCGKVAR